VKGRAGAHGADGGRAYSNGTASAAPSTTAASAHENAYEPQLGGGRFDSYITRRVPLDAEAGVGCTMSCTYPIDLSPRMLRVRQSLPVI
jgi:hypothetical protein